MQHQRRLKVLRRGPEAIVDGVVVIGRPRRRRQPYHGTLETRLGRTIELSNGHVDIVEGNARDADEPLRRIATVLSQPIVVDRETGTLEAVILDPEKPKAQGGVEHFRLDPV
jgi:hypothetical protein